MSCANICRGGPAGSMQAVVEDWLWAETIAAFRISTAMPRAGPSEDQRRSLGDIVEVYEPLRQLLACLLRPRPVERCSAASAARRHRAILDGRSAAARAS
mmetsp:Transcript_12178/g.33295  ORF Transcript_12178/g.33295 Transcript_12178/m.33295 type:complete len:100 (-) Transcript_12178:53-352(-)